MTVKHVEPRIPDKPEPSRTTPEHDEVVLYGQHLRVGMVVLILNPTQRFNDATSHWAKITGVKSDGMITFTCEYADGATTPGPRRYNPRHYWLVKRSSIPHIS